MGGGGRAALEAVGMVITALAAPTAIHAVLDPDSEPWWGLLDRVPGGLIGRTLVLALVAVVAIAYGSWAHLRRRCAPDRTARPEPHI